MALAAAVFGQCTFDPDHLGDLPAPTALWPSEPVPSYLCEPEYDHDISVIVPATVELLPLITCTINSVTIVDLLGLPGDYAVDFTGNGGTNVYPGGSFSCAEIKSSNPTSAAAGEYPLSISLINDLDCGILGNIVVADTVDADSTSQTLRVVDCGDCADGAAAAAPTGQYTLLRNVTQKLELSWGRVAGAVGYRVSGGPIPALGNLSPQLGETNTSTVINYTQLASGATYRWGVAAGCGSLPSPSLTPLSEFDTFASPTLRIGQMTEELAATASMTAFPNPASEFVMLQIESEIDADAVVNVYDATGRLVMSQNAAVFQGGNMIKYDLDLEPGMYIVELGMGEETITQQISVTE